MFTFLNRPPNQECVYNLIEQTLDHRPRGPPMYRSKFSCMVRQEANCRKTGCFKTMGVPKTCLCPPENYLKKNSRAPITIKPPAIPRVKISDELQSESCPDQTTAVAAAVEITRACDNEDSPVIVCEGNAGSGSEPVEITVCEQPSSEQPPCDSSQSQSQAVCSVPKCRVPRICCNVMKPPVPCASTGFEIIPRGCKNWIHSNVVKALRLPPRKPALRIVDHRKGQVQNWNEAPYPRKYVNKETFGCVPSYIRDIKEQLRKDDLQAKYDMKFKERDVDSQIRHLDPTEHQAIVCGLKKNWEEKFAEFQSIPLLVDTPGKVQKKSGLEEELKKLEKDIQLLERHDHIFVSNTCRSFYLA